MRIKKGVHAKKKHRKILKQAKGYYGARSKQFKTANSAVLRAMRAKFVGRKLKKRNYRKMWITRINAATRMHGMSYSRFMNGLKKADINLNRKMLSEIAIHDPEGFGELVKTAKENL